MDRPNRSGLTPQTRSRAVTTRSQPGPIVVVRPLASIGDNLGRMKTGIKDALAGLFRSVRTAATPVSGQPLSRGLSALDAGEFAKATAILLPLAEQGVPEAQFA